MSVLHNMLEIKNYELKNRLEFDQLDNFNFNPFDSDWLNSYILNSQSLIFNVTRALNIYAADSTDSRSEFIKIVAKISINVKRYRTYPVYSECKKYSYRENIF